MEDGAAGNQSGWDESAVTVWRPQGAPLFQQELPVCSAAIPPGSPLSLSGVGPGGCCGCGSCGPPRLQRRSGQAGGCRLSSSPPLDAGLAPAPHLGLCWFQPALSRPSPAPLAAPSSPPLASCPPPAAAPCAAALVPSAARCVQGAAGLPGGNSEWDMELTELSVSSAISQC